MTVVLLCGAHDYQDRDAMGAYLLKLPKDVSIRLCGSAGVNALAFMLAKELGLEAQEHENWNRRMEPGSRASTIFHEVRPSMVLAFADSLFNRGELSGTGHMVNRAIVEGVRATIVPSRRP